jgi:hypothetical protein
MLSVLVVMLFVMVHVIGGGQAMRFVNSMMHDACGCEISWR